MNFIKTMVDLDEENPIIKVIAFIEHYSFATKHSEQDGKEVVIGLRPEHITEQQGDDLSATTKLDLQLEVLEPTNRYDCDGEGEHR